MTAIAENPATETAPPSASIRWTSWLLRVAILLHAIGITVAIFTRAGTPIGEIALMDWNVSHSTILLAEKTAALTLLAAALSLFIFPFPPTLLFIAAVISADAFARQIAGGEAFFEYALGAAALRYAVPLALIPLVWKSRKLPASETTRAQISSWILRIGVATVFLIHGIEAFRLHPGFIDLLIGSTRTLLDFSLPETTAKQILQIIGIIDILVAALVLFRSWWPLLAWLGFWGLVTALSRPLAHGFASYPEVLVRSSHLLAPLAIFHLTTTLKSSPNPKSKSKI